MYTYVGKAQNLWKFYHSVLRVFSGSALPHDAFNTWRFTHSHFFLLFESFPFAFSLLVYMEFCFSSSAERAQGSSTFFPHGIILM